MTVLDFADYRMRMRAGVPSTRRSYYLVGLTHSARRGTADPDGRAALAEAVRATEPHAVVHDPVEAWHRTPTVGEYHRLLGLAASSEVTVAWLPTPDSVTDAAAELRTAHRAGATVVAITADQDDLLVRAFATTVVPDLSAFTAWVKAA